eukprot:6191317-Pleurochrysis_carterae.AAC.1
MIVVLPMLAFDGAKLDGPRSIVGLSVVSNWSTAADIEALRKLAGTEDVLGMATSRAATRNAFNVATLLFGEAATTRPTL